MATGKQFFWLKLKREFMNGDEVDFLMNQKNGAQYIVLYQMLCFTTINTKGVLAYHIGEALIPYDVDKIGRDCKYFDRDTVIVALELFKKLGLVYEQSDGVLCIANFHDMVGSKTDWATKKQRQRLERGGDNVPALSPPMSPQSKSKSKSKSTDKESETDLNNKTTTTERARVREEDEGDELIPKGERAASLKQHLMGGTLGQGFVRISDEQFADLCERLSIEELEHYFAAVVEYEKSGKRSTKSHYNAILDMVKEDRRVKPQKTGYDCRER